MVRDRCGVICVILLVDVLLDFGMSESVNNFVPSAGTMSNYYSKVYVDICAFANDVSPILKVTYNVFVRNVIVSLRCVRYWDSVARERIEWKFVWRDLKCSLSVNITSELRWRIIQRIVKVRLNLRDWAFPAISERCEVCHRAESIEHCFLECNRVKRAWDWVKGIVSQWFQDLRVDVNCVFLGLFNVLLPRKKLVMFVVESMLNVIWFFRNRATFHNNVVSYRDIIRKCRADIAFRFECREI